jgi:hypothetical protein
MKLDGEKLLDSLNVKYGELGASVGRIENMTPSQYFELQAKMQGVMEIILDINSGKYTIKENK